jgi:hypothetical protein
MYNSGSTVIAGNSTASLVNLFSVAGDGEHLMADGWFRAKGGFTHREMNWRVNLTALSVRTVAGEWTNTATNVTSISLVVSQGTANLDTGSTLAVWRRKP